MSEERQQGLTPEQVGRLLELPLGGKRRWGGRLLPTLVLLATAYGAFQWSLVDDDPRLRIIPWAALIGAVMVALSPRATLVADCHALSCRARGTRWRVRWTDIQGVERAMALDGKVATAGQVVLRTATGPVAFTGVELSPDCPLMRTLHAAARANQEAAQADVDVAPPVHEPEPARRDSIAAGGDDYQLGGRRAAVLTLDATGLIVQTRLRRRVLPWANIRGVRWLGDGAAEVLLTSGYTLGLPSGTERIRELVAQIEAACESRVLAARAHDLGALLSPAPAESDQQRLSRYLLSACRWVALAAPVVGLVAHFVSDRPGAGLWAATLDLVLAAVLWVINALVQDIGSLTVTEEQLIYKSWEGQWSVAWRDVTAVEVATGDRGTSVRLQTAERDYTCVVDAALNGTALDRLAQFAQATEARFAPAGEAPVPETALSPARLAGADVERGLSAVGLGKRSDP